MQNIVRLYCLDVLNEEITNVKQIPKLVRSKVVEKLAADYGVTVDEDGNFIVA